MKKTPLAVLCLIALVGCDAKKETPKAASTPEAEAKTGSKVEKGGDKAAAKTEADKEAAKKTAATKTVSGPKTDADKQAAKARLTAQLQAAKKKMESMLAQPAQETLPAPADVAAAPADAVKTASGLASKVLRAGKGAKKPTAADTVKVHYTGWTTDGKMFDSSVARDRPATFALGGVIKGWTEGVAMMVEGEKRRFWIPGNLAYGDKPAKRGAPSGPLVFDVELISIEKAPVETAASKAVFQSFLQTVKSTAARVCACKDAPCAQEAIMQMRKTPRPRSRPSPDQMKLLLPHMERLKTCGKKIGFGTPPNRRPPAPPTSK